MTLQTIDSNTALLLYGLARQADRSIDHALVHYFIGQDDSKDEAKGAAGWVGLTNYYDESKRQYLRRAVQLLCPAGFAQPQLASDYRDVIAPVLERRFRPVSIVWLRFIDRLVRHIIYCQLPREEAEFIAGCLVRLLQLLDEFSVPNLTILSALRIDFTLCEELLFQRCRARKEFDKAGFVENFCQPGRGCSWGQASVFTSCFCSL